MGTASRSAVLEIRLGRTFFVVVVVVFFFLLLQRYSKRGYFS